MGIFFEDISEELEIGVAEIVALVACFYLIRSAWRQVPPWAKPEWLRRWEGIDYEAQAGSDLDNPFAIASKLQEIMSIAKSKCDTATPETLSFPAMVGCFLALVRLWQEIRLNHPNFREEQYHDYEANRPDGVPGRHLDPKEDDLEHLYTFMEYSQWAYREDTNDVRRKLNERGFDLIRQDLATEPGRVGHYVALDYTNKIALVGIKGTSHVGDIFTDLVANATPNELTPSPFKDDEGTAQIQVHEGIWLAATRLGDELLGMINNLFLPQDFRIILCGHSLGAGTSCLLGLYLRSRVPALKEMMDNGQYRLRVMAFATPAVLNFDACVAAAPFCTSVVNNSDIVPRASVSNLVIMNQLLVEVKGKTKGKYSEHIYKVAKNVKAFYRNLTDLIKVDDDLLMSPKEWDAFFDETHRTTEVAQNLYVPGKVICLYEKDDMNTSKAVKEYGAVVGDGGMKMLRQIEFTSIMVSDHSCGCYFETIRGFTKQTLDGTSGVSTNDENVNPSASSKILVRKEDAMFFRDRRKEKVNYRGSALFGNSNDIT
eukprot:scaffold2256_cov166-Amphora_coffeaeformis.AAC.15